MSHAILICDDDPDIRGAMKRTLHRCDVREAGSPREAPDMQHMQHTCALDAVIPDFSLEIVLRVRPEAAPGGG